MTLTIPAYTALLDESGARMLPAQDGEAELIGIIDLEWIWIRFEDGQDYRVKRADLNVRPTRHITPSGVTSC